MFLGPLKIVVRNVFRSANVSKFSSFCRLTCVGTSPSFNKISQPKRYYSKIAMTNVLFRQLFDYDTYTYTYIVADADSHEALIIDPVLEKVERDLKLLKELGLKLKYACSGKLKESGCLSVVGKAAGAHADQYVQDGDLLRLGGLTVECLRTPGHTNGCMTYLLKEKGWFFTGDVLFIRGCGRTDFQQGDPKSMYKSVHEKIFSHPDHCLIYPGHDYNGHTVTTVGEEKKHNPRLSKSLEEFVEIMNNLKLQNPKYMDVAIPANEKDGIL